jgi:hypothetical protein
MVGRPSLRSPRPTWPQGSLGRIDPPLQAPCRHRPGTGCTHRTRPSAAGGRPGVIPGSADRPVRAPTASDGKGTRGIAPEACPEVAPARAARGHLWSNLAAPEAPILERARAESACRVCVLAGRRRLPPARRTEHPRRALLTEPAAWRAGAGCSGGEDEPQPPSLRPRRTNRGRSRSGRAAAAVAVDQAEKDEPRPPSPSIKPRRTSRTRRSPSRSGCRT